MDVVAWDPMWPVRYEVEAERVAAAFGAALRAIEHVGSTAVPGLAAKPVIDVMAAVDDLPAAEARSSEIQALGYRLVPTGMRGRLFLQRGPVGDAPAVNLHVVTLDTWPSRKERTFRDRLLHHPEEAAAYGAIKRRLIARHLTLEDYTRAKTAFIQAVMDRAADEAGRPREDVWED